MRISSNGLAIVKAFEGCRFVAYRDSVGIPTICYGHTNAHPPKFQMGDVWTQAQCDEALRNDMATFEAHVTQCAKVPLKQHEFDALVSWSFNTGGPITATLWKALNAGQKTRVPSELARWNRAGGRVLPGLTRRRRAEALLFQGDIAGALIVAGLKKAPQPVPQVPPDVEPTRPAPAIPWWKRVLSRLFRFQSTGA